MGARFGGGGGGVCGSEVEVMGCLHGIMKCVFGNKRGRMGYVGMRWELCTYMAQRMLIQ